MSTPIPPQPPPHEKSTLETTQADLTPADDNNGTINPKKLMLKIDLRVVPCLCILYLLAFLDRVNISNAVIYGLKQDLNIDTGMKYNIALVIFFVPYVLFEIPSNMLLKRFKPHVWLPGCMFMFGLMTVVMGLVQGYNGLLTVRFFLGFFESGVFPGCFYLLSCWYSRAEAQKRYSFFFSSTTLAGAFGGLLAAAIGKLDHHSHYRAWRYIFIIEGSLSCLISLLLFFAIPDFPEEATFLTPQERTYIQKKLQADSGESHRNEHLSIKQALHHLSDYRIIIGGWMYFGLIVPAYSYAYFSPSIVRGFGYGPISTQLHSVPPWVCAFGLAMITATLSDRLRHRFTFVVIPILIALTGFAILLNDTTSLHVKYFALFLCAMGAYSAMPIIVCWFTCNLASHGRRAIGSGFIIGFGNIGGIIATFSFLQKEAPHYRTGYSVCIAFVVLSLVSCCVYLGIVVRENKRKDEGRSKYQGLSEEDLKEMKLGDLHPDFRYMK